jgi:uncharacterized protein YyaL (SSP411 family)
MSAISGSVRAEARSIFLLAANPLSAIVKQLCLECQMPNKTTFDSGVTMGTMTAILAPILALSVAFTGELQTPETKLRPVNRLAQESSPYLRQHAHNPVDWYPWGPEAFAQARRAGKLVFLSIGYSSCHWCHVMERESFDNPAIAKLMNDWFVCIKVDREERPDIDTIYMTALNVLGERGGWPLSMFLTADGKPIIGGTYWPPEDKEVPHGKMLGFKTVLKTMHDWHSDKANKLQEQADTIATRTAEVLGGTVRGIPLIDLDRDLVVGAIAAIKDEFDSEYGGFGNKARGFNGTKFPVPPYLELLLHEAIRTKSAELTAMVTQTLDHMARGGIYDHLGGGFHRYSTERTWTVPHFEKMLYDNAQLVEVYSSAYGATRNPLYRRIVEETLAFIDREMTSPEGGFYSALDADSGGVEGQFYVWTDKEIDALLSDRADAGLVKKVYGAEGGPNFESSHHILLLPKPLAEIAKDLKLTQEQVETRLTPLRKKLFDSRSHRSRPFLDTKILTGWNGQMIAGYAVAGQVLGERKYIETAIRATDFLLKNLRTKEGRLLRAYAQRADQTGQARLNAYLDDYAFLTHGLLCLHEATAERKWLDEAKALTDAATQFHADKDAGGFFYTSNDHEKLFARAKDQYDGAQPSGNSVMANNLVRLWIKTGDNRYGDLAKQTLNSFKAALKTNPTGLTAMADALALYLDAQAERKEATPKKELVAQAGGAKRSDSVVKVQATAAPEKPGTDGIQTVMVMLAIDKGWHIYANPVGQEDLAAAQTTVTMEAKTKPEEVKIDYPKGKAISDKVLGKYWVYEDKVSIKATIRRAAGDTSPLEVTIKFQSCSDQLCLLPATVKVTVP